MTSNQEDYTAPVTKDAIKESLNRDQQAKSHLVETVLRCLNEKRDAYNGVISSIIYMIDDGGGEILELLKEGLRQFVTVHPMRYGEVFLDKHQWTSHVRNQCDRLRLKMVALRAMRQAEQKLREKPIIIPDHQISTICEESLIKGDSETKIDTLCVILDTKMTTKVLTRRELDIYLRFFREALDLQVPALRQKFLTITNKTIKRLKDSARVVWRELERFQESEREETREYYMDFLKRLIVMCLDNTYPNKYFGSFVTTTTTLSYIIEHIGLHDSNLPVAPIFSMKRCYDSFLECLVLDTFEDNKKLALKLLSKLQTFGHAVNDDELSLLITAAYQLAESVNPAHSLTCQYIFKLVIGYEKTRLGESRNRSVYKHLDKLVCLVEEGNRAAKENFFKAIRVNAVYPKMTCIRALLDEIDVKCLKEDNDLWIQLTGRLVRASIEACRSVSSLVCNMNPETIGHLPMDQEPIDVEALSKNLDKSMKISDDCVNTVTSQHLLITGWKTIKESSLSMGVLCARLWWTDKTDLGEPVVDSESIKLIVDFFMHYLKNLRHRGAFEQAYNGFVMVTRSIWMDDTNRNLLVAHLDELLDDFRSEPSILGDKKVEYLQKHVTRRSAGLPFLVQAIAISEHRREDKVLRHIMDSLISVMFSPKTQAFQKIHCLNILKALTIDNNLAEKVIPYLGQIFVITIEAFKSDNFSIRNCASMLMRALVDRCFGVGRSRGEVHKRNTMSYEKFFSLYPDIHAKMGQYLVDGIKDTRSLASVHAVYIILAHLKPSVNTSEEYSAKRVARPYVESILQLAMHCPDLKLRELSAKMLARLENQLKSEGAAFQTELFSRFRRMISSGNLYQEIKNGRHNATHGMLCVLRHLMDKWYVLNETEQKDQMSVASELVTLVLRSGEFDESKYLRLAAIDLCESCSLVGATSKSFLEPGWSARELLQSPDTDAPSFSQLVGLESLAFRSISLSLMMHERSSNLKMQTIEIIISFVRRQPDRYFSDDLQAALIRFLRQFFSLQEDFIDKLYRNFDYDPTAAHSTPIDKLNQKSELDSEREVWVKYCDQPSLRHLIRDISGKHLDDLFSFYQYEDFAAARQGDAIKVNSPKSIELLVFACKAWDHFNLEERCIWFDQSETLRDKLQFVIKLVQNLPDCDAKCLLLVCAARLFRSLIRKIHAQFQQTSTGVREDVLAAGDFSLVVEELTDSQYNRNVRETTSEMLNFLKEPIIVLWCEPLKEPLMNVSSAIIRLCQDEDHEVREAVSRGLIELLTTRRNVSDLTAASGSCFRNLLMFVIGELLDPTSDQDAKRCVLLLTRIIFEHSRSSSISLHQERESLFDKTRANVFADHVATIEATLAAAEIFFAKSVKPVELDRLRFPLDVLNELSISECRVKTNQDIGDYSWRSRNEPPTKTNEPRCGVENWDMLDGALRELKQNLHYFRYSNMLIDTSFGFHESTLFRHLAFIKLLTLSTNYNTRQILAEVHKTLTTVIDTSCATTLLLKCRKLLD